MKRFNRNIPSFLLVAFSCDLLFACGSEDGDGGGSPAPGIGPGGGSVSSSDGKASVTIPAGALSQNTSITIKTVSNPPSGNIGNAYEFGPDGTTFSQPVTIQISYGSGSIPSGMNPSELVLGKVVNSQWQVVSGSSVDTAVGIVSGTTSSFSIYGVLAISPGSPAGVSAVGADGQVTVSWDAVSGATSYNIYWNTAGGVTTSDNVITNVTSPHTHMGLTNGTTYYYIVTAVNRVGESGLSAESSATPMASVWQAGPPLNTARNQFAGGVIDGKIYVFGGNRNPDGLNLKSTELLDPASGSWVYKTDNEDNGGQGVEEISGAVANGKLYVFGAWGGGNLFGVFNFVEEYDPATDTWTSKAPMPTTRAGAVAVTYNNKIYVFGGQYDYDGDVTGTGRINYDVVEAYDPGNNTWQTITHMPTLLQGFAVGVVGDNAYVIGGADDSPQPNVNVNVYAYNFTTGNWTTSGFAQLPTPGIYPYSSAAPVVNGKIYLIGGGITTPNGGGDNVDIYDPVSNIWQTDVPLPTPTAGHLSVVVDNKIYVIGGDYGSNATITATVWSLDLSSRQTEP